MESPAAQNHSKSDKKSNKMDYEKLNEVPHCVRNDSLKDF